MSHRKTDVNGDSVVWTLAELERWKQRQAALKEELDNVNRQVAYYETLASQMKRRVRPARVTDLLAGLR